MSSVDWLFRGFIRSVVHGPWLVFHKKAAIQTLPNRATISSASTHTLVRADGTGSCVGNCPWISSWRLGEELFSAKTAAVAAMLVLILTVGCAAIRSTSTPIGQSAAVSEDETSILTAQKDSGVVGAQPTKKVGTPYVRSGRISKDGGRIQFDGVELVIPPGALEDSARIEIRRVESDSLPSLSPGMINVTKGGCGYRFYPLDAEFQKPVWVSIPVEQDSTLLGLWLALGMRTYYWDENSIRWLPLAGTTLDPSRTHLVSQTAHFTLMINAVLKAPDQARPSSFDANSIKDLAAAEPTANVDLIQPPDANYKGDARLSFPIRLPKGRGAHSPELELPYSSARGNGPLGIGWDLPVSRVEVDTRWGVPHYDGSERFLLNGASLVPVPSGSHSACVHGSFEREFAPRIQTFQRVCVCTTGAGGPRHWEVTNKDGTRFEYGIDEESRLSSYQDGEEAHTAEWFLRRVVDTNGNTTDYRYQVDTDQDIDGFQGEPFVKKYLSLIEYTSHATLSPTYRARLEWTCGERSDPITSGKTGFKVMTRCVLDSITVQVRDLEDDTEWKPIRRYDLTYEEGAFCKTLLEKIRVFGAERSFFYEHSFDYTQPEYIEYGDGQAPFDTAVLWPVFLEDMHPLEKPSRRLRYTSEEGGQASGGVGVAFEAGVGDISAGCTVGASAGVGEESPEPRLALLDVNGDRIADRIWLLPKAFSLFDFDNLLAPPEVRVALGQLSGGPQGLFGVGGLAGETRTHASGLPHLGAELSSSANLGVDASCHVGPLEVSGGMSFSVGEACARGILFDVDGDGRVDLLSGGAFYAGLPRKCRDGTIPTPSSTAVLPYGVCNDGLLVCLAENTICFGPPELLSSHAPPAPSGVVIADGSLESPHPTSIAKYRVPPQRPGTVASGTSDQIPEVSRALSRLLHPAETAKADSDEHAENVGTSRLRTNTRSDIMAVGSDSSQNPTRGSSREGHLQRVRWPGLPLAVSGWATPLLLTQIVDPLTSSDATPPAQPEHSTSGVP